MKVAFFEIEEWEKEFLKKSLQDAVLTDDELTVDNAPLYSDAEIISCFISITINRDLIDKLPNLKLIVTRSTGFDHIDVEYCKTKNIVVSNVPEYGSSTVAEHTFALLLNLTRKIPQAIEQIQRLNFDHSQLKGIDLCEKTIGIIGLGKIGQHVLRIAQGFGIGNSRRSRRYAGLRENRFHRIEQAHARGRKGKELCFRVERPEGFRPCFQAADLVSIVFNRTFSW